MVEERRRPELYPSTSSHLGGGSGEGHSTKRHNFMSLRAVRIDSPGSKRVESGGWGTHGVRMEANALGGGQDISQRPRVHTDIHMSTSFPQKALQRPGPAQSHCGANLGTCPQ